jgi:hypothetical protein
MGLLSSNSRTLPLGEIETDIQVVFFAYIESKAAATGGKEMIGLKLSVAGMRSFASPNT